MSLASLSLKIGRFIFIWAHLLSVVSHIGNAEIPQIYLTWMTSMKPSIMSSYHSQTQGLGKATVTEVVVAFGPYNVYCGLCPLGANVAMVDGQNQHPWGCLLGGNLPDSQT